MKKKSLGLRWISGLLAVVMMLSLCIVPVSSQNVASAHWADASMIKLRDWGIMRGDQNGSMEPDRAITRAEFVTMVNRTFGYDTTGKMPFKDVKTEDWYANDINIAYNQGYFVGSTKSTASPNASLTREEAITLIGRNLMFTPDNSENMYFTDGRDLSSWSRSIVNAAVKKGIVRGDAEGTFRPQARITRGEVASLLERTIGIPLNQPTQTSLGMVSGNVMISSSGVELSNTTINGDLYITAGVGLGYVKLNNVKVNGQVIASGAGVSNRDTNSVIMRNCTINELIVDSPNNVAISMRAEGNTTIGKTFVRTDSYLEDNSVGAGGFQYIEVDGEEETRVDLTGDFNEVVLKAVNGTVALGRGSIRKLTVDEQAVKGNVIIDVDALISEVYLDTATTITGSGDIGYLKVNASGCKVSMLPDKIEIRPGITANINGQDMTSKDAELSSSYPRILAGYPKLDDVGPNAANAVLNTNKTGTIYWGVTLEGDKALSADELIKPPSYGDKSVTLGTSSVKTAENDFITAISKLKPDTEYIYSAVLVDSRGDESAVKTRTFTTPDNTVPAFAAGYPRLDWDGYRDEPARTNYGANIEFVATKISKVYWAVYKKGLPAPTADELRTQTMTGQVKGANGVVNAKKNEPGMILVNGLEEVTEYDMYLMLSDGINHSAVRKLSFKTADKTPPEMMEGYPKSDNAKEKSVDVKVKVNEDAVVYWVAVKRGDTYPVPPDNWEGGAVGLDTDEAKSQVMSGSNAFKSGRLNVTAEKEGKFTISGLEVQTGYDVYLLPVDKAGNMAKSVIGPFPVKTLDVISPTAKLVFDPDVDGQPMVDSNISIEFSEEIRVEVDENGKRKSLHEMKDQELLDAVTRNFTFYDLEYDLNDLVPTAYTTENVVCELVEGKTVLTFKPGALDLYSGNKYKVVLNKNIYDTSNNKLDKNSYELPFTTVFSRIIQKELDETPTVYNIRPDVAFEMRPQATKVSQSVLYDLIFWSDSDINFQLFEKRGEGAWEQVKDKDGNPIDGHIAENGAVSLAYMIHGPFPELEKLADFKETRSYAIKLTKLNGRPADQGNKIVNIYSVPVASGNLSKMQQLANNPAATWEKLVNESQDVTMIGMPKALEMFVILSDTTIPSFVKPYPNFDDIGDSIVMPQVQVDRRAKLHYVIAPQGAIKVSPAGLVPPTSGDIDNGQQIVHTTVPTSQDVVKQIFTNVKGVVQGSFAGEDNAGILPDTVAVFEIEGLEPNVTYDVFFVLEGINNQRYSEVYYYQITTKEVEPPDLKLDAVSGSTPINISVSRPSKVWWKVYQTNLLPPEIKAAEPAGGADKEPVDGELAAGIQSIPFALDSKMPKLERVANLLMGNTGSSDDPTDSGVQDIDRNNGSYNEVTGMISYPVDVKNMLPKQTYTMVALARNALGGKYVLYRLDNIVPRDDEPPQIVSIIGGINKKSNGTYYGTVTVTFTEPLFYKMDTTSNEIKHLNEEAVQVKDPKDDAEKPGMMLTTYSGTSSFVQGAAETVDVNGKTDIAYKSMQYTFANWSEGDNLQFNYTITDKNGLQAGMLILKLETEMVEDEEVGRIVGYLGGQEVPMWIQ